MTDEAGAASSSSPSGAAVTGEGGGAGAGGDPDGTWEGRPRRLPVNVVDLRRRLGQRREEPVDIVLPPRTVIASRTTPHPVVGSLTIESIERGVSVTGAVRFRWQGECRRCLELVEGETEVEIDEIYQVDAPEDSDLLDFGGEQIDLVPLVADAVGLSLPLAPLCRDDCAGPDPDRYPARSADESDGDEQPADPRWAALDQLDFGSDS